MGQFRVGSLVCVSVAVVIAAQIATAAQPIQRTGTRLGSDTTARTVIHFGSSNEIRRIRDLLEEGLTNEAVEFAEDYVRSLDSARNVRTGRRDERYYALNALCAARTKAGLPAAAIEACSEAIERSASTWNAFNSRGGAYFSDHQYESALEDYRHALSLAPRSNNVATIIEHNIELALQRVDEVGGAR